MKNKKHHLNGFTIIELLIVLGVIGILITLAMPDQTGIITTAKEKEAQLQLKQVLNLQQYYYNINSKYTNNLDDLDFVQKQLVTEGGTANYKIEVIEASSSSFSARATAVVDFDQDGTYNIWEIDNQENLERTVKD